VPAGIPLRFFEALRLAGVTTGQLCVVVLRVIRKTQENDNNPKRFHQ
jgi:hypothetical protein